MTLRPDSIVRAVTMGGDGKANGVSYIDRLTKQEYQARGRAIVVAASTLESTRILLNSTPGGLGNSSGMLGQYLMDQVAGGSVTGFLPQLKGALPRNADGKASGAFIPNFRNLKQRHPKFIRGYCISMTGGKPSFRVSPHQPRATARASNSGSAGTIPPLRGCGSQPATWCAAMKTTAASTPM